MTLKSIKHNPFKIVRMFEEELEEYTGAPHVISVDSCTNALFLCCLYLKIKEVTIPSKTYLSVPQSILQAGGSVVFNRSNQANDWIKKGFYQLKPYPIWDYAKLLTSDMYIKGQYQCISFHIKKSLPIGKGGVILTDNPEARDWFKRTRYEGRSELNYKDDIIGEMGWNMYMTPEEAARGLCLLQNYPANNPPIGENNGYRDLYEFPVFKDCKTIDI